MSERQEIKSQIQTKFVQNDDSKGQNEHKTSKSYGRKKNTQTC
jgi:hypothetical protein